MAAGNTVYCPVCGATSKADGFGREGTRVATTKMIALSADPVIVARRNRARMLRTKNGG